MRMRRRTALLLMVATAAAQALDPPPGKPPVRNYLMAEYGGHVNNWVVRQGPDQRIVVGSGDGLVIFDGASWQSVPSHGRSRIRVMEIDDTGRIWTGSPDEFGYFEPGSDGGMDFHSLSDLLPEDKRAFGEIRNLHVIDDAVYFHSNRSLFRWHDGELAVATPGDLPFRITVAHQDRLLVLMGDRFHDYTEFPDSAAESQPEPGWRLPDGPRLLALSSWPDGRILMSSVDDGLYWLSEGEPEHLETDFDLTGAWPLRAIPSPRGGVLVATYQKGLFHIGPEGEALEYLSHRNGLAVNPVLDLIIDHENGVWLAQNGAIARVDLFGGLRIYDADFGLSTSQSLIPFQGRWLHGGGTGLSVLSADGRDSSRLQTIASPTLEVWGLLDDGDGVLIGSSEGVHRMVPDLENLDLIAHERLLADTYAYGLVRSRLRDAVYAELESGLGVLLKTEQGWRSLGRTAGVNHRANTIVEDAAGRVWVGTAVGRYYRLAWHGDELVLEAELDADDGVPEGDAWAFTLGERLVLGTEVGAYRPVEPEALRIEPDPHFGNDRLGEARRVFRLYQARNGQLVAGIGAGGALWRGSLSEDGRFDWHGRWLSELQAAVNWFIDEHGDHLWIGRHPGLLRLDWPPAEPVIEASRLQVVRAGYPDSGQWLIAGPSVETLADALPARSESLRFEFALTSYAAPDRTEYRVRLDGLEDEWSRWSRETRRDYTNLAGGDYTFRAQARNAAGQTFESDALALQVKPPLHLGPLALALYTLAAVLALVLAARFGHRLRERKLLAQQRVLAEQVAERTAEVRAKARELREASDARAQFFANVSHELRTPLTLSRGPLLELARISGDRLDAESRQYLDMALRNNEAMQSLIGQVLDFQRLDAGRMPLALREANLSAIVSGIVDRFAVQARLSGVALSLEGIDAAQLVVCDPTHVDTMVGNLLANALKFTPQGGAVALALTRADAHIEISVSDTGPGIDPAEQESIFERYRQGRQTHASSPGTGIGLALVRELAELHGGQVRVQSKPGHGATFLVQIPTGLQATPGPQQHSDLAATHIDRTREPHQSATSVDPGISEDVPCVLLVEDNAELRAFLRLRLGRSYRIEEAPDGAEGLRRARELVPDAIITDGLMPVMDGLAMTREIKDDPELAFVPVLMLTSRATAEDAVRGLEAGADDYLAKPFDSNELAARVAGLIASRKRLKAFFGQPETNATGIDESRFVRQVNSVLDEHLADPQFSVRDWADLLHMDRTTLFRRLKGETGQSPDDYLRERRLQAAARLLRAQAGNVAEVADAVGYASVSHFSRRFRDRFGATPAAYARGLAAG